MKSKVKSYKLRNYKEKLKAKLKKLLKHHIIVLHNIHKITQKSLAKVTTKSLKQHICTKRQNNSNN